MLVDGNDSKKIHLPATFTARRPQRNTRRKEPTTMVLQERHPNVREMLEWELLMNNSNLGSAFLFEKWTVSIT